jgi:hypothetical protein
VTDQESTDARGYEVRLLRMVDSFLAGETSWRDHERTFYSYYQDAPSGALSDAAHDFFGTVCEKIDFTGPDPDAESRRFGWIDPDEYRAWLKVQRAGYRPDP